jgi:hypothetical protein
MTGVEDFGSELSDFRRRVEELHAARSLPEAERLLSLDAALFELRHVTQVLWPRFEELAAAGRRSSKRDDGHEQQLLRSLFHQLPVAVVLLDKDAVVRRMNAAATQLFGLRAGYAAGRPLTGSLTHEGRPLIRTQVAAVGRGEGARSLRVHLLHPASAGKGGGQSDGKGDGKGTGKSDGKGASAEAAGTEGAAAHTALRVTLTPLRAPQDARSGVLAVFQPVLSGTGGPAADVPPVEPGPPAAPPELGEISRHVELLDLVDDMAAALLTAEGPREAVAERAASVLHERFADWVIVDLAGPDALLRAVVLGPDDDVREALLQQDPATVPLVTEAVEQGTRTLQARAEDPGAFGWEGTGSAALVRAGAGSLICVPLTGELPREQRPGTHSGPGSVIGALTLFRTERERAFELAEAGAVERVARHIAFALER